jgi:deoxycytidylate deaminase
MANMANISPISRPRSRVLPNNPKIEMYAYKESLNKNHVDMKQHLGCVIFNKNKIVSKGYNFHSFGKTQTCSCHAEMNAMYKHLKQLDLWKDFKFFLEKTYRGIPVFHRMKGRAS